MIVVGEALVDLVEEEDGRFDARPGGSARNVAIALARLGVPVRWCWGLGDDRFAHQLRSGLVEEGVDLSLAVDTDAPTTLAVVSLTPDGSASYAFHLTGTSATSIDEAAVLALPDDQPLHLSLGAVTLATPRVGQVLRSLLRRRADARALTTLDPNVRPAFLGDPAHQRALLREAAAACAIVRCSQEDLTLLDGGDAGPDAHGRLVAAWLEAGAHAVVVTHGGNGAEAHTADGVVRVPAPPTTVVDTVGAGDTFGAAMLAWLHDHGVDGPGAVAALGQDSWQDVLSFAATAAAVTVSRRAADPPRRSELR